MAADTEPNEAIFARHFLDRLGRQPLENLRRLLLW